MGLYGDTPKGAKHIVWGAFAPMLRKELKLKIDGTYDHVMRGLKKKFGIKKQPSLGFIGWHYFWLKHPKAEYYLVGFTFDCGRGHDGPGEKKVLMSKENVHAII